MELTPPCGGELTEAHSCVACLFCKDTELAIVSEDAGQTPTTAIPLLIGFGMEVLDHRLHLKPSIFRI